MARSPAAFAPPARFGSAPACSPTPTCTGSTEREELQRLRAHVAGVFEGFSLPSPELAVAVGGSASSLRRLVGGVLDHESLERGLRILATGRCEEVAKAFEIDAERIRLLTAGMLILAEISDRLGRPLQVGRGGLREGVILDMLGATGAGGGLDRRVRARRSAAARSSSREPRPIFNTSADVLDLGEIEAVHEMRVATRRLRAALEVFGAVLAAAVASRARRRQGARRGARRAPRPRCRSSRRSTRSGRATSGPSARRSSVCSADLAASSAHANRSSQGDARTQARPAAAAPRAARPMKAQRIEGLTASMPLEDAARRIVAVRAAELFAFVPEALDERSVSACTTCGSPRSGLRYVLELVGFCFGEVGAEAARRARELQEVIGEIHDCDVLLERIAASRDASRRPGIRRSRERTPRGAPQQFAASSALSPRSSASGCATACSRPRSSHRGNGAGRRIITLR